MANPTATVSDFCGVLARSRLLPPPEVAALQKAWAAEPNASDADVDGFRKFLVARRCLTDYQAAMVQRGYADGFYVGGYVILDRIGSGRSAGVYKAVHASGQVVALKVLPGSKAKSPHVLARFQREGRLLTRLDHPNVVRAYQVGETDGRSFIVMEHLDGETLDEVLARRKQIPAPEAARIAYQTLQGLQHLHEKRMVHRDVKPANLIATPPPIPGLPDTTLAATIKILDIGLGRELFDEAASGTHDAALTAEGAVLGTPDYLAPEQARDARGADIRADIYAVGCVLYHLLAGRPPFVEKNVMATMVKHATEPVPPVTQFAPAVPPGMVLVMNRLLAKETGGRYQTPGEAADALRVFLPADAAEATKSFVVPAFEKYLESEPSVELPDLDPDGPPTAALPQPRIPGGGFAGPQPPRPVVGSPNPVIAGTAPAPALAALRRSGTVPAPVGRSGTVPAGARRTTPGPVVPDSLPEIDVELVSLPGAAGAADGDGPRVVAAPPVRPLYDLDRRDFIMLALGGGGVATAVLGGFVAANAMRHKVQGEEEQQKENQP